MRHYLVTILVMRLSRDQPTSHGDSLTAVRWLSVQVTVFIRPSVNIAATYVYVPTPFTELRRGSALMGSVFAKFFPRDDTLLLGDRIGRGSFGEVYRGTLGRKRRPVAVKKIYDFLIVAARESRHSLQRLVGEFRLECELLQVARHPNVVEFIGVFHQGEGEESALLVMELMDQTLEQFLQDNRGTLPQEKQVAICLQITSGLLFLHQHDPQILHRDLTAKNVLMNKEGSIAKISDFGQAKYRPTSILYLTTKQPGTILYMPPECLVDRPHFTYKGDLFSLGVLMLQVTTQDPPSVGLVIREGQPEVERRAVDLAKLPAGHTLRHLILRCLQNDPEERPSCSEVLHYLLFGPHLDIPSVSVFGDVLFNCVLGLFSKP